MSVRSESKELELETTVLIRDSAKFLARAMANPPPRHSVAKVYKRDFLNYP